MIAPPVSRLTAPWSLEKTLMRSVLTRLTQRKSGSGKRLFDLTCRILGRNGCHSLHQQAQAARPPSLLNNTPRGTHRAIHARALSDRRPVDCLVEEVVPHRGQSWALRSLANFHASLNNRPGRDLKVVVRRVVLGGPRRIHDRLLAEVSPNRPCAPLHNILFGIDLIGIDIGDFELTVAKHIFHL